MSKIGLFGGTFDPVHLGHLITAEDILKDLKLDKVIFIPAGRPPHKEASAVTDAKHRLKMLKLAVAAYPGFELSDYELKKKAKCYTIDTVRYFKSRMQKGDKLYFIAGSDIVGQIESWKDWQKLIKEVHLIIMARPGFKAGKKASRFGTLVEVQNIDISSSSIRKMIKKGLPVTYMIPEAVEKYIYEHKLYRN